MPRAKVILIGEMHEMKANVRANAITPVSTLHNYIERKIIEYLVTQSKNRVNYPSGRLNIMFVHEGQDENERNNNIIRELRTHGITNQLYKFQEYSKTIMENPNFKTSYHASGLIAFLKIVDNCKSQPDYKYDPQINCQIDESYLKKMFMSFRLEQFFGKENSYCIIDLIKGVFGLDNIDYLEAYKQVVIKSIELMRSNENSEYSVSELFVQLVDSKLEDRVGPSGLNESIMEQLRNYRDSNLISRINAGLKNRQVDFIVFYFGLNHHSNQSNLITQSEFMELDTLGWKMDKEFLDQVLNPTTRLHQEVFFNLLTTMSMSANR